METERAAVAVPAAAIVVAVVEVVVLELATDHRLGADVRLARLVGLDLAHPDVGRVLPLNGADVAVVRDALEVELLDAHVLHEALRADPWGELQRIIEVERVAEAELVSADAGHLQELPASVPSPVDVPFR